MKGIRNIYRRLATLLCVALAGMNSVCWGQAVTGNKYTNATNDGHDVSVDIINVSGSSEANGHEAGYAIDTDYGSNSYWQSGDDDENPTLTLQVPEGNTITRLEITSAGYYYSNNRPAYVTIRSRNSTDEYWTTLSNRNWSNGSTLTIENLSINDQYIQIEFERSYTREWSGGYWDGHWEYIYHPVQIYDIDLSYYDLSLPSIQHKPAKWYSFLNSISDEAKRMDTFDNDDTKAMIDAVLSSGESMQAAHTYIDTIYMHKGTSIVLNLPDKMDNGSISSTSYQRWYSYRTGGTFATGETGDNNVVDLLTPDINGTFYRFGNGYVGSPIGTNMHRANFYFPTDAEYTEWFGTEHSEYRDNSWYVVACDVSLYNDFSRNYSAGGTSFSRTDPWEPTLSHRIIFYICAVEAPATGTDVDVNWYRKALTSSDYRDGGDKYLEEYDISFPYTRVSNNTLDLVALSKDAWNYAVPVDADEDTDELTVTLIDGTGDEASGIKLASTVVPGEGINNDNVGKQTIYQGNSYTISGNTRVIQFQYPDLQSDGTRTVNNENAKATILVTKEIGSTSYHIAKFNLTFVPETRLLTQTQLANAENNTESQWYFRTDDYISKNFELLTSLDFDYSKSVVGTAYGNGNEHFYPFPMSWESNSYGFYDGAQAIDMRGTEQAFPQWGYYSIMDNFIETDHWRSNGQPIQSISAARLTGSTYHLFVDASDRPGTIARLEFERQLCRGAELFVTAWVKSCVWNADDLHSDAGMLFTIMGVTADGRYVPIYRHNTGQIRQTNFLSDNTESNHTNINNYQPVTIDGSDKNEWYQAYFSFINDSELSYEKYVLQIDNNSLSTEGGDMYIDNICVYMAMPNAYVEQLAPSCIGDATSIRLRIEWDRLLSRTGDEELQTGSNTRNLSFCFVDRYAYEEAIANGSSESDAIQAAMVAFSRDEEGGGEGTKIGTLTYDLNYERNNEYDTSDAHRGENGGNAFYRYQEEGNREDRFLAIDLWATDLIPTRRYYLLIDETGSGNAANFGIANPCAIKTEFMVESTTLIKMNGQVVTPETEFCVGQVFNFTAQLRIDNGTEEGIPVTTPVFFDWFFGSADDYLSTNNVYNVSIEEALANFRGTYPEAEVVSEDETPVKAEGDYNFTEAMLNLLIDATASGAEEGLNARLVLRKQNLNISILREGLFLVIRPIQTVIYDEEGEEVNPALICWNYVPLTLKAVTEGPHANTGFWEVNQPDGYAPALRIGLKQIQSGKPLTLDLRDVECATESATRLERITSTMGSEGQLVGVDLTDIFLIGTTDPLMQYYIDRSTSEYDLPIGELTALYAEEGKESSMTIKFNLDTGTDGFRFNPREGYEYTFNVHFQEDVPNETDEETIAACYGKLSVTMKVVPEYLIWDGTPTDENALIGNWNNDSSWKRVSTKERIHKPTNDTYPDGNDTENGYVPMLFSKVIMPENSKVYLYAAGFINKEWMEGQKPDNVGLPTTNIQYDMMAYDNDNNQLTTERYRVALCDEIHFESGAEMLYAEYLLYNKAWVDYELDDDRWHLLASPLQGVVAGDFYAPTSGRQETEYFQPIRFGDGGYNRFNPSVYQRGWKSNTTEVNLYTEDSDNPKNVAIAGNWSSLYNDVAEEYAPGTGFSLKVLDLDAQASGQALFRLPKADETYTYYNNEGNPGHTTGQDDIDRTDAGRLMSDKIYHRTETNASYNGSVKHDPFTVDLSESANGDYYLVGNPFMAHLNMKAFLEKNTNVLDSKYWYVGDDGTQNAGVVDLNNDATWINAGDNSLIPPLRSFFVKKKKGATSNTITFTHDMQALGNGATTGSEGEAGTQALWITATNAEGKTSRALVAYDAMTSDDYQSDEDAELFLDSNLGDVPMVYTVAGTMATSINARPTCERVPLGVYGTRDEEVTLRFEGTEAFGGVKLYDARTGQATALRESTELRVATNDYGRYYLIGGVPTGAESIHPGNDIEIYSIRPGEIVVTTTGSPLRTVCVYGVNGALVARQSLTNQSVYRLAVPGNALYMIYAEDAEGIIRNVKMQVR